MYRRVDLSYQQIAIKPDLSPTEKAQEFPHTRRHFESETQDVLTCLFCPLSSEKVSTLGLVFAFQFIVDLLRNV